MSYRTAISSQRFRSNSSSFWPGSTSGTVADTLSGGRPTITSLFVNILTDCRSAAVNDSCQHPVKVVMRCSARLLPLALENEAMPSSQIIFSNHASGSTIAAGVHFLSQQWQRWDMASCVNSICADDANMPRRAARPSRQKHQRAPRRLWPQVRLHSPHQYQYRYGPASLATSTPPTVPPGEAPRHDRSSFGSLR